MLRPRIMPCLLLKDGSLVKTTKFDNPSYVGDAVNAIKIFNGKEVDELVLMIYLKKIFLLMLYVRSQENVSCHYVMGVV